MLVALGGAGLLDEVERSGTRRVQTARAWPRAAQHKIAELSNLQIKKTYQQLVEIYVSLQTF